MLVRLTNALRRRLRARRRAGDFPVRLPHGRWFEQGIDPGPNAPASPDARTVRALELCDGTRTAGQVASAAGIGVHSLVHQHDLGRLVLWRGPLPLDCPPGQQVRQIIVSPHIDDAVLGLGGTILAAPPFTVLVLDVCTATAWWRWPSADSGVVSAVRREEERLASRLAGFHVQDLNLPEAMLRGRTMETAFTDEAGERDRPAIEAIRWAVRGLARRHPAAAWLLPLGVGNHLDHRIARDAALGELSGAEGGVRFYEDLPYAAQADGKFESIIPGRTLVPETIDIEATCRWKLELARVYFSQFMWTQVAPLGDHARRVGGGRPAERVWRFA